MSTLRAVGYLRASTEEQGETGATLQAQETTIRLAARARGWRVTAIHQDVLSGKDTNRPGLQAALAQLGPGDVLVVAKLDRLTRSVADFGRLLEQSQKAGWSLCALDLGVDTSTPAGELVASVMAAVAQWERRAISERTKAGLEARRAQGVRLGRPRSMSAPVYDLAAEMLGDGWKRYQVAAFLNAAGVPTARGGQEWRHSSLKAVKFQ
jgi:DNA invertase Pin-like site-specific DNA recombinase